MGDSQGLPTEVLQQAPACLGVPPLPPALVQWVTSWLFLQSCCYSLSLSDLIYKTGLIILSPTSNLVSSVGGVKWGLSVWQRLGSGQQ